MNTSITYVGMDTHKKEHTIALHYPGQEEIVRLTVRNTAGEIRKLVNRIRRQAPGEVRFCYEAGVCGFVLKRRIESLGCSCSVIAPSLTPVKPGERIKTDRRDALKLLQLFKAGLLTEIYAPEPDQEAARELTRCRDTARVNLRRIQHQVVKYLTRHGYVFTEGDHWTQKHFRWMHSLEFDRPRERDVFDNYFTELQHAMQRLASLDKEVAALAEEEPYREIVGLLRCFYAIDTLTAVSMAAELFSFGRFASPRDLMSYLGVTPSEHSSGQTERKGAITKTGNRHVRRLLVQTAWNYRHPYTVSAVAKAAGRAAAVGRRYCRSRRPATAKTVLAPRQSRQDAVQGYGGRRTGVGRVPMGRPARI